MTKPPQLLDRAGILARIPHQGRMALLDALCDWSPAHVHCTATGHTDANHPLRTPGGLLAPAAIEYAAQAMALHGALVAPPQGSPTPGYLASVRQVRLSVATLHDRPGPLHVRAQRLAGDERQVLYTFEVSDSDGVCLADGRATVVLNTPATLPGHAASALPGRTT
ncbi:MAG: hydroxymyristoyl-ACP dehydratase [Aquabacterium sp.]|jgi:predicted hotdog family 3-hydroxylacyl-ACP dehydratase|nr:hydroxymyristoyl-ACP dehydratase [Aquabacterium sp.]